MAAAKLDVPTADGVLDVHLYPPPGPGPTVILFPDAGGVRPVMHEMAERLASGGYLVALPNMYYRAGAYRPFDAATLFSDPAERARMGSIVRLADAAAVRRDTGALLDALADRPGARADRVGCVGYCLGGYTAFATAGAHPTRIAAAASIHGGRLATDEPDSPHRQAADIQARLYFAVAADDASCTPESQARLAAALDQAGVTFELEQYAAAHGFAVPDNLTYDPAAAEHHWDRLSTLFTETLRTD